MACLSEDVMKFYVVTDSDQHREEEFKELVPAMKTMEKCEFRLGISRWDMREKFSNISAWVEANCKGRIYLIGHLAFYDNADDLMHLKLRWAKNEEA
jgi:hypothetical protein